MKLFIVVAIFGYANAAKLSNQYIPPPQNALSAGGAGLLDSPNNQYLPPSRPGSSRGGGQPGFGGHGGFTAGGGYQGGYGGQQGGGFTGQHGGGHVGQQGGGYAGNTYQPQYRPSGQQIPIIRYNNINNGDGSYHFDYETGNGISQTEDGHLNNAGTDHSEQVVEGEYSYTGDDGKLYKVTYKADANGFQAYGDHFPTPPPIPEEIQKSIALNAAAAARQPQGHSQGQYSDGQYNQGQYNQGHQGPHSQGGYVQQPQPRPYSPPSSGFGGKPQNSYLPPHTQSFSPESGYQY